MSRNVATLEGLFDDVLGVELLTQVDIENLQAVVGSIVEELADGSPRRDIALSQRAEAYGTARLGYFGNLGSIGDVVPCHAFLDFIGRNAVARQGYLYRTCWVGYTGHEIVESVLLQGAEGLFSQGVLAQGADGQGFQAKLACMIGKVSGCATQFLTFGKYIPQGFSESYYITFCFHIIS